MGFDKRLDVSLRNCLWSECLLTVAIFAIKMSFHKRSKIWILHARWKIWYIFVPTETWWATINNNHSYIQFMQYNQWHAVRGGREGRDTLYNSRKNNKMENEKIIKCRHLSSDLHFCTFMVFFRKLHQFKICLFKIAGFSHLLFKQWEETCGEAAACCASQQIAQWLVNCAGVLSSETVLLSLCMSLLICLYTLAICTKFPMYEPLREEAQSPPALW